MSLVRRVQHFYNRFARPMTIGVQGVVIRQGQVFLVRHSYVPGWHFPGGAVEPGETARTALERELREEGEIVVTGRPRLFGVYFNNHHSRRDHIALFLVEDFEVLGPRKPDWEIREARFFALDTLPDETTPSARARLAEILGGQPPADVW